MRRWGASLIALIILSLPATSAFAADNGTVGVTVGSPAPCVTVTGNFAYGSHPFSTLLQASKSGITSGPSITNCGGAPEQFFAHTSNLTNGGATWGPVQGGVTPCPVINVFGMNVSAIGTGGQSAYDLTASDQNVGTLTDATPFFWVSIFTMPCVGSDGTGLLMSGTITVTASF